MSPIRLCLAAVAVLLAMLPILGCSASHSKSSALTPGAAKKHIVPGQTTQAEVVEIFGTPNVITQKDGYEMWVYDKVSSKTTSAAFGGGALAPDGDREDLAAAASAAGSALPNDQRRR